MLNTFFSWLNNWLLLKILVKQLNKYIGKIDKWYDTNKIQILRNLSI